MSWWNRTTRSSVLFGVQCMPLRQSTLSALDRFQEESWRLMVKKHFLQKAGESDLDWLVRRTHFVRAWAVAHKIESLSSIVLSRGWAWLGHLARLGCNNFALRTMLGRSWHWWTLGPEKKEYWTDSTGTHQSFVSKSRRMKHGMIAVLRIESLVVDFLKACNDAPSSCWVTCAQDRKWWMSKNSAFVSFWKPVIEIPAGNVAVVHWLKCTHQAIEEPTLHDLMTDFEVAWRAGQA